MAEYVVGRIPVLECLRAGRRPARRLFLLDRGKGLDEIEKAAANVPIEYTNRGDLDRRANGQTHQGVILETEPLPIANGDEWVKSEFAEDAIVIVLDGIEDPHNFGAIVRSAVGCGVAGIVFGKDRSAPISAVSAKSAAGAMEHAPLVRAVNLVRCLDGLKEAGFWVAALDEEGAESIWEANLSGRMAIVVGNEGHGVRPLMRKHCDLAVTIPLPGVIKTMNASVSAAIALAECVRRRQSAKKD